MDSTTGQAVARASVTVLDSTDGEVARTFTREDGRFIFHFSAAGDYRVRVRRIGYASALTQTLSVRAGVESIVRLPILQTGVRLDTLTIVAESVVVEQQVPWLAQDGFYTRKRKGFGYFLTRKDIDDKDPLVMSDLLRGIPGVRVSCPYSITHCSVTMPAAASMFLGRKCLPTIVLDGQVISVGGTTGGSGGMNEQLNPFNLEAVEIYTSPAGVPVQWGGYISPCGAIVAWSRR